MLIEYIKFSIIFTLQSFTKFPRKDGIKYRLGISDGINYASCAFCSNRQSEEYITEKLQQYSFIRLEKYNVKTMDTRGKVNYPLNCLILVN